MRLSNNLKWIITLALAIVLIVISIYRYNVINKPYKDYTVIEKTIQENKQMEINGFEMTFERPSLIEYDENYLLEIPLNVVNTNEEFASLGYEDFMITFNKYSTNGLSYEEVSNHPENQIDSFALNGLSPGEEGRAILVFNLMKNWGVNEQTDINLYYVTFHDNTLTKYKFPYHTSQ